MRYGNSNLFLSCETDANSFKSLHFPELSQTGMWCKGEVVVQQIGTVYFKECKNFHRIKFSHSLLFLVLTQSLLCQQRCIFGPSPSCLVGTWSPWRGQERLLLIFAPNSAKFLGLGVYTWVNHVQLVTF